MLLLDALLGKPKSKLAIFSSSRQCGMGISVENTIARTEASVRYIIT